MKCPVCKTRTTQSICPNCGYTFKKENQSDIVKEVKQDTTNQTPEDDFDLDDFFRKQRRNKWIIRGVFGLIALFCMAMSAFNNFYDETFNNEPYGTYNSVNAMALLGDHEIFNTALNNLNKLNNTYTHLSIHPKDGEIYGPDYTVYYLKNSLYYEYRIDGYKTLSDNTKNEYTTIIQGTENGLDKVSICIKGQYLDGYNQSFMHLDKTYLQTMFDLYDMSNAYNALNFASANLSLHTEYYVDLDNVKRQKETNRFIGNINGYEISIIETYSVFYNTTTYEYTIEK